MKIGNIASPSTVNKLWQVCYDSGELASAQTSITISGLNGDVDEEYMLICRFVNGYNGGNAFRLRPNNVSTASNYGYQYLLGTDSAAEAGRSTYSAITLNYTDALNKLGMSETLIYAKSGYVRTCLTNDSRSISGTTVTNISLFGQSWNNTADNITSLVISADQTNGLGIGSRIILLKKVTLTTGLKTGNLNIKGKIINTWQKVYSTILTEAATSLTISDLDGNTDVLYRLRARIVNGYNGSAMVYLRLNNDSGNNYGYQYLIGYSTTAEAYRETGIAQMTRIGTSAALSDVSYSDILLYAKSGYIRTVLENIGYRISTTTVFGAGLLGQVWNNTADNITSLVILSSQANGLGIGTTIELEKLVLS